MTLLKIFGNKKLCPEDLELPEDHGALESGVDLGDISTDGLLGVVISFVKAYNGSKDDINSYISRILDLNVFEKKHSETCAILSSSCNYVDNGVFPGATSMFGSGSFARDAGKAPVYEFDPKRAHENICNNIYCRPDRVYLMEKVRSFKFDFIDWDDREFLIEMIKYTFYRSLLMLRSIANKEDIEKCESRNQYTDPCMQAYTLAPCGHVNPIYSERKELLSRRVKPTMSLDDYAKVVLENMKQREESRPKDSSDEDSRDRRPRDEDFADYKRNFRGNTKNVG